jgi:glutathione S-transferase
MLALYHWEPNGFSLEALAALHAKELEFESRYVDFLDGAMWRQPFRAQTEVECNIENEGPVLAHDGRPLTDAFFINLFLDEAYPARPLRPPDPIGRWRVNVWGRILGEDFAPAISTLGCVQFLTPLLKKRDGAALGRAIEELPAQERRDAWRVAAEGHNQEAVDEARRKVSLTLKRVEEALAAGPYLVGQAISLADLCLFGQANALPKLAADILATAPRMTEWLDRMRRHDAVIAALKHARTTAPDECFAPGPERSRWG